MSIISELKKKNNLSIRYKYFCIENSEPCVVFVSMRAHIKIPISQLSDCVFIVKFGTMWDNNSFVHDLMMFRLNDFGFDAFSIDTDLAYLDGNSELLTKYNITQNPTYIIFKGETELTRLTGNQNYNKLKETLEYYVNQNN